MSDAYDSTCKLGPCEKCKHNYECQEESENSDRARSCNTSCPHYDEINQCCWQATKSGLCFTVYDGDQCHLNYSENDGN